MVLEAPVENSMNNQEQLAILIGDENHPDRQKRGAGYHKDNHPALRTAEASSSLESLTLYALSELNELEIEYFSLLSTSKIRKENFIAPKSFMMEFVDFIVMLKIIISKLDSKFSIENAELSVNGQFKGDFSSLKEQTVNIKEGNVRRNLEIILSEALSLLKFLNIKLQGDLYVSLINKKLQLNREARFFQLDKGMNEADMIDKSNHAFKALRLLRHHLLDSLGIEATLQPWITDFFIEEISDWQNSERALDRLKLKVGLFKLKIRDELVWSLTGQTTPDQFLEMKMIIAGAKLIKDNNFIPSLSLQNQASNATLAEGTVFWT